MKVVIVNLLVLFLFNSVFAEAESDTGNKNELKSNSSFSNNKKVAIGLSAIGGLSILSSIPFYLKASSQANDKFSIDANIKYLIGDCLLVSGLLCGGISIPFYIKDHNEKKRLKTTVKLNMNSITLFYIY